MVTDRMNDELSEIVTRLERTFRPERIYLFGSRAAGEGGPDSDWDLLVVVPDDTPAPLRDERRAYEALWGTGTAADVLVMTRSDFDGRKHLRASLAGTVAREGVVVHSGDHPLRTRISR